MAHGMQMEKWRQRFHRFHRAGTSITRFCRREGISATAFYLWRRKLRPEPAAGVGRSHQEDAPAQPRQGSFVPVRMLGGLNFGGQMTMTAELPGGTRLLIPVADRCAKYTKAGHPRVRVPEADLDKQVLAVFDKMRIEDEGVRDWFRTVLASQTRDAQAEYLSQRARACPRRSELHRSHSSSTSAYRAFLKCHPSQRTAAYGSSHLCEFTPYYNPMRPVASPERFPRRA